MNVKVLAQVKRAQTQEHISIIVLSKGMAQVPPLKVK